MLGCEAAREGEAVGLLHPVPHTGTYDLPEAKREDHELSPQFRIPPQTGKRAPMAWSTAESTAS